MPFAVVGLRLRVLLSALALTVLVLLVQPAGAVSTNLVVSQVYGGGGNSGATFTNDFIEIFNRGTSSVDLDGYSLQYASATGTGNFGANSGQLTELPSITLASGQYVLVHEASGGDERRRASGCGRDGRDSDQHGGRRRERSRSSRTTRASAATAVPRRVTRLRSHASSTSSGTGTRTSSRDCGRADPCGDDRGAAERRRLH